MKLPWQPDCQKGKERRAADGKLWKKYISTSCVFGDSNDGFRSCMEMINTRGQGAVWHLPQSNFDASTSTWPKGPCCAVYHILDFIGALFGSLWKQVHSFFPKHLLLDRIIPFHFCPVTFPSWNFPTGRSVSLCSPCPITYFHGYSVYLNAKSPVSIQRLGSIMQFGEFKNMNWAKEKHRFLHTISITS